MTTTNLTSDEREQRLRQIRERRAKLLEQRPTLSWEVKPFDCMCDEACRPFMANAPKDIDFLLSLIDSQAKGVSTDMAVLSGYESGLADAATRMRDKCVEKVKAMQAERLKELHTFENSDNHPDDAEYTRAVSFVLEGVIGSLKSLTLDQVEQEKR